MLLNEHVAWYYFLLGISETVVQKNMGFEKKVGMKQKKLFELLQKWDQKSLNGVGNIKFKAQFGGSNCF